MLRTRSTLAFAVLFSLASSSSRADVYVADVPQDGSSPSIKVFSSNAIGDAAPIRTISGPATELVAPPIPEGRCQLERRNVGRTPAVERAAPPPHGIKLETRGHIALRLMPR